MDKRYDTIQETESKPVKKSFGVVEKFNPYHGWHGYFSTANAAGAYAPLHGKTENGQRLLDHYKETHGGKVGGGGGKISQQDLDDAAADSVAEFMERHRSSGSSGKPTSKDLFNADGSPKKQVTGKDISNDFEFDLDEHKQAVMQVAEKQGFLEKPTVVSKEEFDNIAKETGVIAFRTVSDGYDKITLEEKSAGQFADTIMHGDASKFSLNGDGGQAYGGGMYIATNSKPKPGETPDAFHAREDSVLYGTGDYPAVMTMTISPTAKIGDYQEVRGDFFNEPHSVKEKFDYDVGAYAAAKGYDGLRAKGAGWGSDYITMYNRTALIFSEEVQDRDGDPWVNLLD